MADLVGSMKKAALEAVEASKPVAVFSGVVTKKSPLNIIVEQKMPLTIEQLILTRNVTDYECEVSVDHLTETASGHTHAIKGRKTVTIHNGLNEGDEVILLRVQGGQKFIVLDRKI